MNKNLDNLYFVIFFLSEYNFIVSCYVSLQFVFKKLDNFLLIKIIQQESHVSMLIYGIIMVYSCRV